MRVKQVMQVPDYYDPMREWAVLIPRKLDGSGAVTLWMRAGNMAHFGLDKFPSPQADGSSDPGGQVRHRPTLGKLAGANQGSFRLAYRWETGRQKPQMCRFRLSSNYLIETLEVISQFLRDNYGGPFEIRNANGNYLPSTNFRNFA